MKKKINLKDIAKRAGVSEATVSRALNNDSTANEKTKQKVLKIAREMKYKIDKNRTNGYGEETNAIALLLPGFAGDFFNKLIETMNWQASANGYELYIRSFNASMTDLKSLIKHYETMNIKGVVVFCSQLLPEMPKIGSDCILPVLGINTPKEYGFKHTMKIDNYQGAFALTEHFIKKHGFKKIAIIKIGDNLDSLERYHGYKDALEKHNIPLNESYIIEGDFRPESGFYAFSQFSSLADPPEAIFSSNDMMALGAYEAAISHGVKIGEDIAIAGFDDIIAGKLVQPSLTSVFINIEDLAIKSMQNMLKLIKAEDEGIEIDPISEVVPAGLIVRGSCGCNPSRRF